VKKVLFALACVMLVASAAHALPVGVDLGTGLPPASLGAFAMTPFDPGSIAGESYRAHMTNGNGDGGWATWGQNYTGWVDVCVDTCAGGTLTLSLSGSVSAVYFYMEPNQFQNFLMKAVDSSGVAVSTVINGFHGSSGVGFYTTDGSFLSSISVTATDPSGFAIGEYGVDHGTIGGCIGPTCSVPEYGSASQYLGMGLFGLALLRRRFLR